MYSKSWLFALRGPLNSRQKIVLGILGLVIFLLIWMGITMGANPLIGSGTLASPYKVLLAYQDLSSENNLIKHTFFSLGLNIAGYVKAIIFSLVFGFIVGLYPLFRGLFQSHLDAIRFLPLVAITGIFIMWFGIGINMKENFLAFGILIFLLPVVVQRIDEVNEVYLKTVYTLGATSWQTIRSVYMPSVFSRIFDDIRILTAISWTYLIVAEMIASEGGLGALSFAIRRQGRIDKLFAILLLFIIIGFVQDLIFRYLDKEFFPHKYQNKGSFSTRIKKNPSLISTIIKFSGNTFIWILIGLYFLLVVNEYFNIFSDINLLDYLFGGTKWAIHFIFLSMLFYKARKLFLQYQQQNKPVLAS